MHVRIKLLYHIHLPNPEICVLIADCEHDENVHGLVLMFSLYMNGKRGAIKYREEDGQLFPFPSCRVPMLKLVKSNTFENKI
jgi:hypothetical protein